MQSATGRPSWQTWEEERQSILQQYPDLRSRLRHLSDLTFQRYTEADQRIQSGNFPVSDRNNAAEMDAARKAAQTERDFWADQWKMFYEQIQKEDPTIAANVRPAMNAQTQQVIPGVYMTNTGAVIRTSEAARMEVFNVNGQERPYLRTADGSFINLTASPDALVRSADTAAEIAGRQSVANTNAAASRFGAEVNLAIGQLNAQSTQLQAAVRNREIDANLAIQIMKDLNDEKDRQFRQLETVGKTLNDRDLADLKMISDENQWDVRIFETLQRSYDAERNNQWALEKEDLEGRVAQRNTDVNAATQLGLAAVGLYKEQIKHLMMAPDDWWQAFQKGLLAVAAGREMPADVKKALFAGQGPRALTPDLQVGQRATAGILATDPNNPLPPHQRYQQLFTRPNAPAVPTMRQHPGYRIPDAELTDFYRQGLGTAQLYNDGAAAPNPEDELMPTMRAPAFEDEPDTETPGLFNDQPLEDFQEFGPNLAQQDTTMMAPMADQQDMEFASRLLAPVFDYAIAEDPDNGFRIASALADVVGYGDDPESVIEANWRDTGRRFDLGEDYMRELDSWQLSESDYSFGEDDYAA